MDEAGAVGLAGVGVDTGAAGARAAGDSAGMEDSITVTAGCATTCGAAAAAGLGARRLDGTGVWDMGTVGWASVSIFRLISRIFPVAGTSLPGAAEFGGTAKPTESSDIETWVVSLGA